MRVGSQHCIGGFEGLPVIDALIEGQMGCVERHCIFVGSQQSTGACEGRTVFDTDWEGLPEIEGDMDGRDEDAEDAETEGQINESVAQFVSVGSQHLGV
jgi:hypothetical protein